MTVQMSQRAAIAACKAHQADWNLYIKEVLGVELEQYQKEAVTQIQNNDRIVISACHDVGKTFLLGNVVLTIGSLYPSTKIITTAPTNRQVEAILWSEINTRYSRSKYPLGGRMLQTQWKIASDWFAMGFSPEKGAAATGDGQGTQSSFQGFHAGGDGYLIVIFDEATGIPKIVWTMAEGLLTSGRVKFICIGNPTSKSSEFYKCFSDRAWTKIKWSCFLSPNFQANNIFNVRDLENEIAYCRTLSDIAFQERMRAYKIVKHHLLTLSWVVTKASKWGMEHPLTLSKILGEFPEDSENVKMPLSIIEQAIARTHEPMPHERKVLGVDVARYGADATVLTRLHGKKFVHKKVLNQRSIPEVAGEVIADGRLNGWPDVIVVDETGIGGGVVDLLIENQRKRHELCIPQTTEIRGVQFGASPEGGTERETDELKERYVNKKAYMYDLLSDDLKSGLCLPNEEIYLEELPTILYFYDSKGRLHIESKDEYKKRTGRSSPDHADSLALANYGRHNEKALGLFTIDFVPSIPSMSHSGGGETKW